MIIIWNVFNSINVGKDFVFLTSKHGLTVGMHYVQTGPEHGAPSRPDRISRYQCGLCRTGTLTHTSGHTSNSILIQKLPLYASHESMNVDRVKNRFFSCLHLLHLMLSACSCPKDELSQRLAKLRDLV